MKPSWSVNYLFRGATALGKKLSNFFWI